MRAIHGAFSPVAHVHECSQGYSGYTFPLTTPEAEIPMKQLQTTGAGTPLAWVDGPTPEPKGAEVLLRTVACGVCHSDVHLHDGVFDLGGGKALPVAREGMTLGHEIIGEVVALGPDADGVALGDLRVAYPWMAAEPAPPASAAMNSSA